MSDMKCPVCNTPLEYDIGYDGDYSCSKCGRNKMYGSKELWQELIRTHKALGDTIKLAEEMLKDIEYEGLCSWQYKERLNKITALEQKE